MAKRLVLPPLPDAVATQLGPVPVRVVKKLRYKKDGKKQRLFGRYCAIERVIEISAEAVPVMQWQTLFHEMVHVALGDVGLNNVISDEQVEVICDTLATARVVEMLAHLK